MLKILTINWISKNESTGKIIYDIARHLKSKCEFVFCYECGNDAKELNHYRIASKMEYWIYHFLARLTGLKYSTGYTSTLRLIWFINKKKPDIVHIHCPNACTVNIPWILRFLKKKNIPSVLTNHAEFFYTGNCAYSYECEKYKSGCGNCNYIFDAHHPYLFDRTALEWKLMKESFTDAKNVVMVAVSPWSYHRMKASPICDGLKTKIIENGINTNIFQPYNISKKEFCLNQKMPSDKKIILHVTSGFYDDVNNIKGGKFVIQIAKDFPEVLFVVAGPAFISPNCVLPSNIKFTGNIVNQRLLAKYYSIADLTLVTSKRETYGMVCAESLCCGTPVIGFKSGGMESIALLEYSEFVEYGNLEKLEQSVKRCINMKEQVTKKMRDAARTKYSSELMADKYYKIYKSLEDSKAYRRKK